MKSSPVQILGLGLGFASSYVLLNPKIKKQAIAKGLLKQGKNTARFWKAYANAHINCTVTREMTEYAEYLLNKQQIGFKMFNASNYGNKQF